MTILLALLIAATPPAAAAEPESQPEPVSLPDRFATMMVFGNDPCPRSRGDEIVVCARLPENERYRLPKRFRGKKGSEGPASVAWGRKVESLEYAGRVGLPNSCSPVGSGGMTGCFQQFMRQARQQREADEAEQVGVP